MHHRNMLKASAGLALVLGLGLTALLLGLGPRPAGAQSPAQPFRVSFTAQPEGDGARITGDVYNLSLIHI